MRNPDDLAIRARNWYWYWKVRNISGMSNYQLDAKCFNDTGTSRKRYFERVEATASAPDRMPTVGGKTVLDVVAGWKAIAGNKPGSFASATSAFRSRFWEFLSSRGLQPDVYSSFIQDFADQRGWMRFGDGEGLLYEKLLGFKDASSLVIAPTAYSAMLHKLINDQSIDSLAVLVALYREAIGEGRLDEAIVIKRATICALGHIHVPGMPTQLVDLISWLVRDRVFSNIWITEMDWRARTRTPRRSDISSDERAQELLELVHWYVERAHMLRHTGYGQYPIVPKSPRHVWLIENEDMLTVPLAKLSQLGITFAAMDLCDSGSMDAKAKSDRAKIQRVRRTIKSPPPGKDRFYNDPPPIVCEDLPQPF